ncbi:hypothetical protein KR054_011937 [Drosophila jambulina]|nr:hypothetical protein KR054_011937 [Drosophila jambulina]
MLKSVLQNAVIFRFSNYVCESYNKSWFLFHECRLKAVSREKVILNMNATVLHSVNNIVVDANVFKRESGFKPWLIKARVDCCRFMRKNYNPVAKIVFGLFKEFTNINHTCPYVGPQILSGFYLKPELLRLPIPSGEYMLSLRWFFDQKLQFDTNVSAVFVEDIKKS